MSFTQFVQFTLNSIGCVYAISLIYTNRRTLFFYSRIIAINSVKLYRKLIALTRPIEVKKRDINSVDLYCEMQEDKFKDLDAEDLDENVNECLYDFDKYKLVHENQDAINALSKEWNRRILLESTPLTTVFMFYDFNRSGFAYYADVSVPYKLLNAIAMKYVTVFKCHDLFKDETVLYEPSPLTIVENEYNKYVDEKEDTGKIKKNTNVSVTDNKHLFVKNKNANRKANELKINVPNKFILKGRICEASVFQKQKRKCDENVFKQKLFGKGSFSDMFECSDVRLNAGEKPDSTECLDTVSNDTEFSWKDYKALRDIM